MPVTSQQRYFEIDYGTEIEAEIDKIKQVIAHWPEISKTFDHRWLALKLIENEQDVVDWMKGFEGGIDIIKVAEAGAARLRSSATGYIRLEIADRRYTFISQVVGEALQKPREPQVTLSERIDRVLTHPWLGVPFFLAVMYLVFNLVVNVSAPYLDWIDNVVGGPVTRWFAFLLGMFGAPVWLEGLILDGVIVGVGGVLVFVPGLVVLFLFIALLEDSGYMARVAVVMDRFMSFLGLRGKSFMPMILGFGCAVPAIYATRTLESHRNRILTGLLVPLMSCSARLPVYVVFGLAFFGRNANLVIWGLYGFGVAVAAVVGLIFSHTIFKTNETSVFVIELPPYNLPTMKSLWFHVSQRIGIFIRHAGTIILAASIVIWMLLNMPLGVSKLDQSWFGRISNVIAPVLEPAGLGNWEATGSLITGLIAKEVVVSTMSQIYVGEEQDNDFLEQITFGEDLAYIGNGFLAATIDAGKELVETLTPGLTIFGMEEETEDTTLSGVLQDVFTPLQALTFLVFVLLYVPCVATLGAIRGEFGWKWAVFSAVYQTVTAWLLAVLVYQGGLLLGFT
ncbi:MAG: ferrous iron transport protein B [Anaerolineales bacterium]|nr:MAG: ferrous iron transport protein B [Anaerolineales bacterium]